MMNELIKVITESDMSNEEKVTALGILGMCKETGWRFEHKLAVRHNILAQIPVEGIRAGEIKVLTPWGRSHHCMQYITHALTEMRRMGILVREQAGTEIINIPQWGKDDIQKEVPIMVYKKAEWVQ